MINKENTKGTDDKADDSYGYVLQYYAFIVKNKHGRVQKYKKYFPSTQNKARPLLSLTVQDT